jgi:peptidyl-prolyl cis-trans isomerase SurA
MLPLLLSACGVWGGLFGRRNAGTSQPEALPESLRDRPPARVESTPPQVQGEATHQPSQEVTDRVVAVVNQEAITLMDLLETIQFLIQQGAGEIKPGEEAKVQAEMLRQLIDRRLKVQEALKEKFTVADDEIKEAIDEMTKRSNAKSREEFERLLKQQGLTMEAVRKGVREQLLEQKILRRKVSARFSVTDQEVEAYFNENREKLETGLGYHAKHIVIVPNSPDDEQRGEAARVKAEEVWAKLRAGEDFAELAREYSQDSTAKEGGDLGPLKRGELDPEFESQILRLNPGEFSTPIKTRIGYQIFKLESKEVLSGEALSQALQQVRAILQREKYQIRLEAWMDELRKKAIIEIRL